MNHDELAFRQPVEDNPTDVGARLILADYLQDQGQDQEADFQRILCASGWFCATGPLIRPMWLLATAPSGNLRIPHLINPRSLACVACGISQRELEMVRFLGDTPPRCTNLLTAADLQPDRLNACRIDGPIFNHLLNYPFHYEAVTYHSIWQAESALMTACNTWEQQQDVAEKWLENMKAYTARSKLTVDDEPRQISGPAIDGPRQGQIITADRPVWDVIDRASPLPRTLREAQMEQTSFIKTTYFAHRLQNNRFLWSIHEILSNTYLAQLAGRGGSTRSHLLDSVIQLINQGGSARRPS